MNDKNIKCPKCGGEMEEGVGQIWGKSASLFFGVRNNGKNTITYRCKKCGYLESYAN